MPKGKSAPRPIRLMSAQEQRRATLEAKRMMAQAWADTALQRVVEARQLYERLLSQAQAVMIGTDAQGQTAEYAHASQILRRYEAAVKNLHVLEDRQMAAEESFRQAVADVAAYADWQVRTRELQQALQQEYPGRGAQYEILIRRLVQAEIQAQRYEVLGMAHDMDHERVVGTVMKLVQALQKYTEGLGRDSLRDEVKQGILAALGAMEPIMRARAPQAWAEGLAAVERLLDASA
jgi:hypothetical protein